MCHNKLSISKKIHFRAHVTASFSQITVEILFKNVFKLEILNKSLNATLKKLNVHFKKSLLLYFVEMLLYCCRCYKVQGSKGMRIQRYSLEIFNYLYKKDKA